MYIYNVIDTEQLFHDIAAEMPNVKIGKMFGKMCYKVPSGKAAVVLYHNDMVFKLTAEQQQEALKLSGAHVFEPMAGRKMNGWIQIPEQHSARWNEYAKKAVAYVSTLEK